MFTISIVSHSDGPQIYQMFINSPDSYFNGKFEFIIRENKKKKCKHLELLAKSSEFITLTYNDKPSGFGENHNSNFLIKNPESQYFIVCNPDLLQFPKETDVLSNLGTEEYFLATASILTQQGETADFLRRDINILILVSRLFSKRFGLANNAETAVWCPSVFKIFSTDLFMKLNGYDTNIFMYYEDYDICLRASKFCKLNVLPCRVRHIGRRTSRKNWNLFLAHIKSAIYVLGKKY